MAKIYHRYILQKIYLIEFFNFLKHAIFNQNSLIWEREKKKNIQSKEHRNREDFVSLFIGTQIKNYHFKTNKRKSGSIKFETFFVLLHTKLDTHKYGEGIWTMTTILCHLQRQWII